MAIEVKRPGDKISGFEQLKSYMRQIKGDSGLLFGPKLFIYYDGDIKHSNDPILLD